MKLFVGVAVLLVLIAGGVGIALMTLAPTDLLRDQLISRVKQQTGRDLTLAGGAGLAFWPALGVSLKDVTLSAPPGMEAPPTLVADEIAVRLAIWPLLEGKAVVDSVALNKPVIDLRRDASGRVSWNFASAHSGNGVRYAQSQSSAVSDEQSLANIPPRPEGGDFIATLDRLELSEVEITNGTVSYTDAVTGQAETIRAIDATLSARSIRDPMSLNGSLTARATKFNVSADLSPIKPLLEGKAADVDIKLTSVPVQATVAGKLTPLSANLFVGPVSIRAPNLDVAARLAGLSLPKAQSLGETSIRGELTAAANKMTLRQLKATLGTTNVSGVASVNVAGARPLITADLTANQIDVDAIAAGFSDVRAVPIPGAQAVPRSRAAGGASPQSINDLLKRDARQPEVKGYTSRDGWSEQPYDLTPLSLVDVKATVRSGPVTASGLKLDSAAARVGLTGGSGRINLDRVALYQGTATGIITVDPTQAGPRLGANVTTKDITIRPLLQALAGFSDLDGKGDVQLTLGGQGLTERQLMGALGGKANITLKDGAIIGWNVAELLRRAQQGRFDGLNKSPSQKTDFSSLVATFDIAKGIATNRDLALSSPLLRVSGEGTIDIGRRQINYLARPKLVASLSGQGSNLDGDGITIPVRIKGGWDDPKIRPEIGDVLSDPQALQSQARQLRERFKGKKAGDVAEELLRDNGRGAKELLKGLFR